MLFTGSYRAIDTLHRHVNPDYELEEVHYYITQDEAVRAPRLTEIAAATIATVLSPMVMKVKGVHFKKILSKWI